MVGRQQDKEEDKLGEVGMHLRGEEEEELFQKLDKQLLGKQAQEEEGQSQWYTYTFVEVEEEVELSVSVGGP